MATARFSLAPPQEGDGNFGAVDILGVPSLEWIQKFSLGQVGVAQSCFDSFFQKTTAGLDTEVLDIFSNLAQNNNSLSSWGLPAFESTLIKSVFETQKPYIEAILTTLDALITVEDVIAILKGGTNKKSLKPKTNRKSLYAKLQGIKSEIAKIRGNTNPAYSSFANFSFAQKLGVISIEDVLKQFEKKPRVVDENSGAFYDWATVSAFYSTGDFIEGVPYDYTYIDITDALPDLSTPPFEIPESRNDDNPPVIVFDMWADKKGDNNFTRLTSPVLLPNDWDISTKWFGQWDGWTKNESVFVKEYSEYVNNVLEDEFDREGLTDISLRNKVKNIYNASLPPKNELYRQFVSGNFKEALRQGINIDQNASRLYDKIRSSGRRGGGDFPKKEKIGDYWSLQTDKFGYKPRKLNGNWIDPEVDYHLRLVRVFPEGGLSRPWRNNIPRTALTNLSKTSNVPELSGSNPLVFSYGDETLIDEVLHKSDYLLNSNLPGNYTPNGYTISKTERAYPNYEKRFDIEIIDKHRKDNTSIVETVILGDFDITADIADIFKEIEVNYDNNSLPGQFQRDLEKMLKYDNSTFNRSQVRLRTVNNILDRIETSVGSELLEEIGRTQLSNRITQGFDNLRTDLKNRAGRTTPGGFGGPIYIFERVTTAKVSDLVDKIGDLSKSTNLNVGERVVVKDIGRIERSYGIEEVTDIWERDGSIFGNLLSSVINIFNKTNTAGLPPIADPSRILNGDVVRIRELEATDPNSTRNIARKGDILNETLFKDYGIIYILEGVYKNRKDFINDEFDVTSTGPVGANAGVGNESFYKYGKPPIRPIRSLAAAISRFAQFGATTLPNLIRETSKALSVLKNPFNLIFEIVFEELSDTFKAFDPDIGNKFAQLRTISGNEEKRQFIQNDPTLRNFIALDQEFNYRFVFDGLGVIAIFGQNFGLGIKNFLPNMIFENNGLGAAYCSEIPPDRGGDNSGNYDENGNLINNIDANGNPLNGGSGGDGADNRLVAGTTYELISTEYSTGDFIEGLDYQYYYITLDNQAIINKANADFDAGNKTFDAGEKIRLKLLALEGYQKALAKDPSNVFLNKQFNEIIKENGVQVNMIFQFILSLVFIPIKIVICIIEYIVNFFTTLKVSKLPTDIPKFLKFQWILDFFKPTKILALLGMELNPDYTPLWFGQSLTADPTFKFDVSKIFSAPFLGRMPVFSSAEYPNIVIGGPKMLLTMSGVFCFLENIINEILCFLFNLFNLEKLFPCPRINLSRFVSDTLGNDDINKLLEESDYNFLEQTSDLNNEASAFVYDVTLDDGEVIKDLNRSELQAFVASNRNLRYKYNFDGIL